MKTNEIKRSITPEKAQQILAEMGINIPTSKAALVLDFMYKMAILEVDDFNNRK
ncbi:MAG TPA: hypothetical protein VGD89_14120 [Flavipsychrobacter sp.]